MLTRLLIDSDAFCKLEACNLLNLSLAALGCREDLIQRLPALTHMLRRGPLRIRLGADLADRLLITAQRVPVAPPPTSLALTNRLRAANMDPGEAQLAILAIEQPALLLTHDKRALSIISQEPEFRDALAGKIITVEALLLCLCRTLGTELVRTQIEPYIHLDGMFRACFSSASDPIDGLISYISHLRVSVAPLRLWTSEDLS